MPSPSIPINLWPKGQANTTRAEMTPGISCPSSCEIMVHLVVYCALLYCSSILVLIIVLYLRPTLLTFANPVPPQNKNCTKFSWFEQLRALLKMRHLIISKHILTVAPIHRFYKFQPHHSIVLHSVRIWIQQNRYSQIMRHCKQDRTIETEPRRTVDLPQN